MSQTKCSLPCRAFMNVALHCIPNVNGRAKFRRCERTMRHYSGVIARDSSPRLPSFAVLSIKSPTATDASVTSLQVIAKEVSGRREVTVRLV